MGMPIQLARAKRPKRTTPRPLVELLPRIDIIDLCRWKVFPDQYSWDKVHYLEKPFRYPFLKSLVITLQYIEANHHNEYNQIIPLRWVRTGFGGNQRPRPLFICQCGRSVTKIYFKGGHLGCRRCVDATYASRVLDKHTRPILQALRLQAFLKHKPTLWHRTRKRLQARISPLPTKLSLTSKRITDKARLPQRNYQSQAFPLQW
jgi:hypothetical protein